MNFIQRLSNFYTKLAVVYQHKQRKDEDEAKRLAYVAIRNALGAVCFFFLMTIASILDLFIVSYTSKINIADYRLQAYAILGTLVLIYLRVTKKFLLPRLTFSDSIEVNNVSIKNFNRIHIGFILGLGLFGGLMFVINRLLYINFR